VEYKHKQTLGYFVVLVIFGIIFLWSFIELSN